MDVYLVPAGASTYALYCEMAAPVVSGGNEHAASWIERMKGRFRRAVDEGEASLNGHDPAPERGRLRRLVTRKLAEAVAEQRLLWHLRQATDARLLYPDTLTADGAISLARAEFAADYGRHRRWMIVDALLTAITGPLLFLLPGPNLVSWYFTFRAIGHFFSMRGARRALAGVTWTAEPTPHLTAVADALSMSDSSERETRIDEAGQALGLTRLASFVLRVAGRTART